MIDHGRHNELLEMDLQTIMIVLMANGEWWLASTGPIWLQLGHIASLLPVVADLRPEIWYKYLDNISHTLRYFESGEDSMLFGSRYSFCMSRN
ncbi:hypothetical protein ACHAXS_000090 [Conticribra weissflogii]